MWLSIAAQLLVLAGSALTVTVDLECQPGWTNVGIGCYRLFSGVVPWDSAQDVCKRYGSQLLRTKDIRENEGIGVYVLGAGASEIWIAFSAVRTLEQLVTPSYLTNATYQHSGHVDESQCVLARFMEGHVVWAHAPCERKSAYVCQRPAAPSGCYHCTNGHHVLLGFTCDGDDDCGDGSDEVDCSALCTHHMTGLNGSLTSLGFPQGVSGQSACSWLIEVPLGYNALVQFTYLTLDPDKDVITVLAGGMTVSSSHVVARLSGDMSSSSNNNNNNNNNNKISISNGDYLTYISNNNLLIVTFKTDKVASLGGFTVTFKAVQWENFPAEKLLTATREVQDLYSPFYPAYLGTQDYTWVITAEEPSALVTLEVTDVDLRGNDRVLFRDGNSAYHPLLLLLTSSSRDDHPYVQTTGRHVYITMQTRGLESGRGFYITYWQGCSVSVTGAYGDIVSPGYRLPRGQYPPNQTCTYDVTVPDRQTVTVMFKTLELGSTDQIVIYEGRNFVSNVTNTSSPPLFDISTGSFQAVFRSDVTSSSRGFDLAYSIGCPKHRVNSRTVVTPETHLHWYRFGAVVSFSCNQGYAFPVTETGSEPANSFSLECVQGGEWNVSAVPPCKPYCSSGWFNDVDDDACRECPVGQYQPELNAVSCLHCPPNTTTELPGTNSSRECKTSCPAGSRYIRGLESCVPCPVGFYQDSVGQFRCHHCPTYKSTTESGASSVALCNVDILEKSDEKQINEEGLMIVKNWHHHHHRKHVSTKPQYILPALLSHDPVSKIPDAPKSPELSRGTEVMKVRETKNVPEVSSENTDWDSVSEELVRVKRADITEIDDVGSCSGDPDPCNNTVCGDNEECIPSWDGSSVRCECKADYRENATGHCVKIPDTFKLFLTTPLQRPFDTDLDQFSQAFAALQRDCDEAFSNVFGIEGCKALKVLLFRSASEGEVTIVVYQLLFSVEVTRELLVKVAQTVVTMEERQQITIGGNAYSFQGHTGIFDMLNKTVTTKDSVNWCNDSRLNTCINRKCVDNGLRYSCVCHDGYSLSGSTCVNVGGIVGGILAGLFLVVFVLGAFFFVRKFRRRRNEMSKVRRLSRMRQNHVNDEDNGPYVGLENYGSFLVDNETLPPQPMPQLTSAKDPYDPPRPTAESESETMSESVYDEPGASSSHLNDKMIRRRPTAESGPMSESVYNKPGDSSDPLYDKMIRHSDQPDQPDQHTYQSLKGAKAHADEAGYTNTKEAEASQGRVYENMVMGGTASASQRKKSKKPGKKPPKEKVYSND